MSMDCIYTEEKYTVLIVLCCIYIFFILISFLFREFFVIKLSVLEKKILHLEKIFSLFFCPSATIQYEKDIVSAYSADYAVWQQADIQLPCSYPRVYSGRKRDILAFELRFIVILNISEAFYT